MRKRFSVLLLFGLLSATVYGQTARELIQKSLNAMDVLKTARYTLDKIERIDGKPLESQTLVKLNVNPHKVYIYSVIPNPGAQVLYVKGQHNDHAMVNANKFPFITIKLNPSGSLMRENQHHTIHSMGFGYLKTIIKNNITKKGETFYTQASYEGLVEWKGREFYKIILDNRDFAYFTYEVQKGENLTSIANKFSVSDYMIMEANRNIKWYDDVRKGQKIRVPNSYARKIVLYLDKIYYLPFVQQIYDDKGLFEQFEMSGFIHNPNFDPSEFTPNYRDYHF